MILAFIILTGLLVRADGWGTPGAAGINNGGAGGSGFIIITEYL
jgi:hypothetical protein